MFNIKIQTTPFKPVHGVEHHNQIMTTTLLKVKDDIGCDYETNLSWALCAKNINNHGSSPSQLVFGKNTNLPNLIDNKLTAQEKLTLPDIALHIQGLIQGIFEIGNCFWARKNWHPNFDKVT